MDAAALAAGTTADALVSIVCAAAPQISVQVIDGDSIDGEAVADSVIMRHAGREVSVPLAGPHNLANAWLAWQVARAAGCDAQACLADLATVSGPKGRLSEQNHSHHTIIDDSYNANPASMQAGLSVLAGRYGARLAVLGGMGELGLESDALHRQVGSAAARLGLPLITVGASAEAIGEGYRAAGGRDHCHVNDRIAAADHVLAWLTAGPTTVLVKASRSAGLDALVHTVAEQLDAQADADADTDSSDCNSSGGGESAQGVAC